MRHLLAGVIGQLHMQQNTMKDCISSSNVTGCELTSADCPYRVDADAD